MVKAVIINCLLCHQLFYFMTYLLNYRFYLAIGGTSITRSLNGKEQQG